MPIDLECLGAMLLEHKVRLSIAPLRGGWIEIRGRPLRTNKRSGKPPNHRKGSPCFTLKCVDLTAGLDAVVDELLQPPRGKPLTLKQKLDAGLARTLEELARVEDELLLQGLTTVLASPPATS